LAWSSSALYKSTCRMWRSMAASDMFNLWAFLTSATCVLTRISYRPHSRAFARPSFLDRTASRGNAGLFLIHDRSTGSRDPSVEGSIFLHSKHFRQHTPSCLVIFTWWGSLSNHLQSSVCEIKCFLLIYRKFDW
jgi:hypothetical protein